MGGRGTYCKGINGRNLDFQEVGYIEDAKVIKYKGKFHKLPDECGNTNKYILLDDDEKTFYELRVYGKDHKLQLEIAFHAERVLKKTGEKVLHYHLYTDDGTRFIHHDAVEIRKNDVLYEKYKKYFVGVEL